MFARRVVLGGTDGRNDLRFSACHAKVRGRGGADTLARSYDSLFKSVFCPRFPRARLDGGRGRDDPEGNDVLRGGPGNDQLLGGEGRNKLQGQAGKDRLYGGKARDHADGGPGRRDLCRAEQERRCEL